MAGLLTAIGLVVTDFVGYIGDITTALITNEVFQIVLAIGLISVAFALTMSLVGKIRGKKKRK